MARRGAVAQLFTKISVGIAGLLLVSMLLSAMPGHHAPAMPAHAQNPDAAPSSSLPQAMPGMDHSNMPGMDMSDEKVSEARAVHDMSSGHHDAHSLHMHMTEMRPQTPVDVQRANEVLAQLRAGMEKYKDFHAALNDGYKIFLPNLPQPEYHFTSYQNGFLEAFSFDPARPTSLLYKKNSSGYELVGAMYTMPKRATEEQLNERVPLSVAMWHLHTNLCMPPKDQFRTSAWSKFGLKGSIATEQACDAAGGRFQPVIFGWMLHVYPYEDSLDNVFAMHNHME